MLHGRVGVGRRPYFQLKAFNKPLIQDYVKNSRTRVFPASRS